VLGSGVCPRLFKDIVSVSSVGTAIK
jgi:hypothetical protein